MKPLKKYEPKPNAEVEFEKWEASYAKGFNAKVEEREAKYRKAEIKYRNLVLTY